MLVSPDFQTILQRRVSRRNVLRAGGALALAGAIPAPFAAARTIETTALSSLRFAEIARGLDARMHVAEGYHSQVMLRWGDPLFADAPAFDPAAQTPEAQARQFGYNNDFVAYFPLDPLKPSSHGLLCVNHEYTNPELMFPGGRGPDALSEREKRVEMEALGVSVVEIRQTNGTWKVLPGQYSRRVTATTPIRLSGPAAGSPRLRTSANPTADEVLGTFANCAGGMTPWNTYLSCEENVDGYFHMNGYEGPEKANHDKMTMGKDLYYRWDQIDPRFDVKAEPNEPNRFGWVVEIDPFAPDSRPVKRTALGRFKREGASCVQNYDGRVVVYSGDDEYFQYIYRFVSRDPYEPGYPNHNRTLLDNGTLSVARFREDGSLGWLPLVFGEGPLTPENGFHSQADVLIEARRAGDLLGATPMDRPEDVEVNPVTGRVYAVLTKNGEREEPNAVNRRAPNPMGYMLEFLPPGVDGSRDHAADRFAWEIFLEGGDPQAEQAFKQGEYGVGTSERGWLACPDNLAFDRQGRIWITTDGQESAIDAADAVYAADCTGPGRAITHAFARGPKGCEMTGPCFTPNSETFFIAVQHPGEGSTFDEPATRWPDFDAAMPPRSAVVAITRDDGGVIGGLATSPAA